MTNSRVVSGDCICSEAVKLSVYDDLAHFVRETLHNGA